jgi:hypothetical protein
MIAYLFWHCAYPTTTVEKIRRRSLTPMHTPGLRGYEIRFREPMQHFGLAR